MELTAVLSFLALALPVAYGAPTEAIDSLHADILEAMKRDLGLDTKQAIARINHDLHASSLIEQLRGSVQSSFAGGWIKDDKIYIGVTDQAAADHVVANGALPVIMNTSLSKLENAKKAIDNHLAGQKRAEKQVSNIASYFVDVMTNKLVVEALETGQDNARELAKLTGLSESEFEIRLVDKLPTSSTSIVGGNQYYLNDSNTWCSVGFSVTGGFVSAGHCGRRGDYARNSQNVKLGTFAGSSFPGRDMSYIETYDDITLKGLINNYQGGTYSVKGSSEAAVGASICRSGNKTGVRCGTISNKDESVLFDGVNTVNGLTRTSACCDHGDSGGPYFSGTQGQGVCSGQNGDCNNGGHSWFYPLNPILDEYGVSLITA